jgi:peroxidase
LDSEGPISSKLLSAKNFGIQKLNVINKIKSVVEASCPGTISCTDIIALAARETVHLSGDPIITIPLGRRDSITANNVLANQFLPSEAIGVDLMVNLFVAKGMTLEEVVPMLGKTKIFITYIEIYDRT